MNCARKWNDVNYFYFILRSLLIDDGDISIPLQMLEVFTDAKTYHMSNLSHQDLNKLTIYLVENGMISFYYISLIYKTCE